MQRRTDPRRGRIGRQWDAYRRSLRADDGYVLAITALLLLPLLAFTAYAVDLGAWQARGAQLQRAADAAALAGAPYMPDFATASDAAEATLRRNGYIHNQNGIQVDISEPTGTVNKIRVTVTDTSAEQYFSGNFRNGVSIERRATAQKLKEIPMGSPRNYIGTNRALTGTWRENFSLAIAGYCTPKEQGDRIVSRADWAFNTGGTFQGCNPGSPSYVKENETYDTNGYVYAVEMPETFTGSTTLRIDGMSLAPCATSGGSATTNDASALDSTAATNAQTTQVEVRRADDPNPHAGTSLITPLSLTNTSGSYCGNTSSPMTSGSWRQLWSGSAEAGDKFYVIVKSPITSYTSNQGGNNLFSLRARTTSTFSACTGDPADVSYDSQCPNVHAVSHLGNYLNAPSDNAQFYLAAIPDDYSNHELEVYLWDPGEGAAGMELLDPNGDPADFTAEIACQDDSFGSCAGEAPPPGGYGPMSDDYLDLGNNANFPSGRPSVNVSSQKKYNDRLVRLTVQLPEDIEDAYGGKTWWKVKYYSSTGTVTDRTTWSISIKGDPVRLVPND